MILIYISVVINPVEAWFMHFLLILFFHQFFFFSFLVETTVGPFWDLFSSLLWIPSIFEHINYSDRLCCLQVFDVFPCFCVVVWFGTLCTPLYISTETAFMVSRYLLLLCRKFSSIFSLCVFNFKCSTSISNTSFITEFIFVYQIAS